MKLPLFGESLYDERTDIELLGDELQLLLYIVKSFNPMFSKHVFKKMEVENWHLSDYYNTLAMVVSVLLNEEVEENNGLLFIPIAENLVKRILDFNVIDFLNFFEDNGLLDSMSWIVSEFFREEFTPDAKDITFDFASLESWYDIECLNYKEEDKSSYELFALPFSEYIKNEVLQFDEKKGCYFLMISFDFLSGEMICDFFFNVYDEDYLFKIGVLQTEEEYDKKNRF